jgi:hypothetical protein
VRKGSRAFEVESLLLFGGGSCGGVRGGGGGGRGGGGAGIEGSHSMWARVTVTGFRVKVQSYRLPLGKYFKACSVASLGPNETFPKRLPESLFVYSCFYPAGEGPFRAGFESAG